MSLEQSHHIEQSLFDPQQELSQLKDSIAIKNVADIIPPITDKTIGLLDSVLWAKSSLDISFKINNIQYRCVLSQIYAQHKGKTYNIRFTQRWVNPNGEWVNLTETYDIKHDGWWSIHSIDGVEIGHVFPIWSDDVLGLWQNAQTPSYVELSSSEYQGGRITAQVGGEKSVPLVISKLEQGMDMLQARLQEYILLSRKAEDIALTEQEQQNNNKIAVVTELITNIAKQYPEMTLPPGDIKSRILEAVTHGTIVDNRHIKASTHGEVITLDQVVGRYHVTIKATKDMIDRITLKQCGTVLLSMISRDGEDILISLNKQTIPDQVTYDRILELIYKIITTSQQTPGNLEQHIQQSLSSISLTSTQTNLHLLDIGRWLWYKYNIPDHTHDNRIYQWYLAPYDDSENYESDVYDAHGKIYHISLTSTPNRIVRTFTQWATILFSVQENYEQWELVWYKILGSSKEYEVGRGQLIVDERYMQTLTTMNQYRDTLLSQYIWQQSIMPAYVLDRVNYDTMMDQFVDTPIVDNPGELKTYDWIHVAKYLAQTKTWFNRTSNDFGYYADKDFGYYHNVDNQSEKYLRNKKEQRYNVSYIQSGDKTVITLNKNQHSTRVSKESIIVTITPEEVSINKWWEIFTMSTSLANNPNSNIYSLWENRETKLCKQIVHMVQRSIDQKFPKREER